MDVPNRTERTPTIPHLREIAAARVGATSLRRVAREIGMSPTGLRKFLDGGEPYAPTVHRLRVWYLRFGVTPSAAEIGPEDASAALAVLVHDLPETPRRQAADGMLESLGRSYEASGRGRPPWVAELREQYGTAVSR